MKMNCRQLILMLMVLSCGVFARDRIWVQFIGKYVANEEKPTILIFESLCWDKNVQVNLANEISKIGGRWSTSMDDRSKYQYHELLYLTDLDCPQSEEVLHLASSRNLFRSPYRWLVITSSTERSYMTRLWNYSILTDSDVVVASKLGTSIKLVELHKTSPNHTLVSTLRGYYNGTLKDVRPHRELFRRRRDVMGHTITMSNVIQDSNSTRYHLPREDGMEPEYDSIPKICWMNVRLAFQMLNATPGYIFSYRWGYKVDGKWSGMINDLYTGRADLGTNCVVSDTERLDVVSYTDRLAPFRVRFIYRQPPLPYVSNIFAMPFSSSVWIALTVCVAVSTVTLYLAVKWEAKDGKDAARLDGLSDAMLLAFSAISQQGCAMEPKRTSGRMVVFVVFTALMALYAAYAANIVVLLQAPSDSIRSLPQLAAAKITLAANDVDYNHFVFRLYKDPVRVTVYKRIDPEKGKKHFYSINEGVERIRQGLFAFHSIVEPVYRRIEETFLENEKCDLMEIDFMNSFDTFVPVRKDSPYLELLRVVFKQIRESGIQSALAKRLQVPKPHCTSKMSSFSSVGLLDMRPVLILMLYGICLSLAIVCGEIVLFKLMRQSIKSLVLLLSSLIYFPENVISLPETLLYKKPKRIFCVAREWLNKENLGKWEAMIFCRYQILNSNRL